MAIKDVLKVNRKTFINPRAWLGYDLLKQQSQTLYETVRGVFTGAALPDAPAETFEQAKTRLNLTEEDIQTSGQNYLMFAILYAGIGLVTIGFGIYLLVGLFISGFIISLSLAAFLFGQAFRNHFWYFQIKNRKLGCTLEEWRSGSVKHEDSP